MKNFHYKSGVQMSKKIESIKQKMESVFLPGSPIANSQMLFGRNQEVYDLKKFIRRPGQHAIVIGDRGVGKTSLVKSVLNEIEHESITYTCNKKSDYNKVFNFVFNELNVPINEHEVTRSNSSKSDIKGDLVALKGGHEESSSNSFRELISKIDNFDPNVVFKLLSTQGEKKIIVLDEYDAINEKSEEKSKETFHSDIAYTIKTLADNNSEVPTKILIVGVSRDSESLIGEHESIQRNLREIFLRPLKSQHVYEFFEFVEDYLEIKFETQVIEDLVKTSLGYPYYFHLVGLESVEAMISRKPEKLIVTWNDYESGYKKAVEEAFRAELSKYKQVFYSDASRDEKNLLISIAIAKKYPLKREELANLHMRTYSVTEDIFNSCLVNLTQKHKILHMSRHSDKVRFFDPLLRPFIIKFWNLSYESRKPPQRSLFDDLN